VSDVERGVLDVAEHARVGEGLRLVVFNCHGAIDGRGRAFDLVARCAGFDADLVVLPEYFLPDDRDAAPFLDLGALHGYQLHFRPFARARLHLQPDAKGASWGPVVSERGLRPLRLETTRAPRRGPRRARAAQRVTGAWGLALISRQALREVREVELPVLVREPARRAVVVCAIGEGDEALRVVAAHLGHLSHGSVRQIGVLRRTLGALEGPVVCCGDMNCFGPLLVPQLPGFRRAVRGRTWPAWRPIAQPDHVLVNEHLDVLRAKVLDAAGSDHRPVSALIARRSRAH
jgi:endonuclease/exonuclease/phosphatase family metal-dependent hydrolase